MARSSATRACSRSMSEVGFASRSSARRLAASARSRSMSSARSATCARIDTRSATTSAKPPATNAKNFSLPFRYHISPGRSAASSGAWPGSTPKSPASPGITTSSTSSWAIARSGVTNSRRRCAGIAIAYCCLAPLDHFVDRTRPGRTPAPGISSCLPSTISLKPRTVSAIGTYLPL